MKFCRKAVFLHHIYYFYAVDYKGWNQNLEKFYLVKFNVAISFLKYTNNLSHTYI